MTPFYNPVTDGSPGFSFQGTTRDGDAVDIRDILHCSPGFLAALSEEMLTVACIPERCTRDFCPGFHYGIPLQ